MAGLCYRKYHERGLWFEMKCLEELIASPTARENDKELAKKILKAYKQLSEKDYNESCARATSKSGGISDG